MNQKDDFPDCEDLVIQNFGYNNYKYIRNGSHEYLNLAEYIDNSYGKKSVIVPSGMSAISTCLLTILNDNKNLRINIVYSSELYCETSSTIIYLCNQFECTHKVFDIKSHKTKLLEYVKKLQSVSKGTEPELNILFTESCSNPNGYVFDYNILNQINKLGQRWINIIDNTWLTHTIQNPFDKSEHVDYVVTSLTKYYSGGNAIAGAIISKNQSDQEKLYKTIKIFGLHTSPLNCGIIFDAVKNISSRITKASENTLQILDKLKSSELDIYHPYISGNLTNTNLINESVNSGLYPSVFTIKLSSVEKSEFVKIIKKSKIIDYKTSFGYKKSRIDTWPKQYTNGDLLIRVSVGYSDNPDEISNELVKIISQTKKLEANKKSDKKKIIKKF
jgi:cystathionine beta-lyase/cystathionine gamma-synthase